MLNQKCMVWSMVKKVVKKLLNHLEKLNHQPVSSELEGARYERKIPIFIKG